ncbi:MAG: PIN domain nuclease [Pseudonocardia sp.]|nr:PIN domain nuclease [Pseudonocardia sp.]
MALTARLYLADKSALARFGRPEVASVLQPLFATDVITTCGMVDLEVLYSARSPDDYERLRADQRSLRRLFATEDMYERALDVQRTLARTSRHRGASIPDLIVAACAETNDATLLHYDADFDLIAGVTGQATQWVVPRGSID